MASALRQISGEAWKIVVDPRANRIERLEALKLIAACKGVLLPNLDERWLSVRQVCQLRHVKQQLVEKVLLRKARKKKANRKQYIKRRLKKLEARKEMNESGSTAAS